MSDPVSNRIWKVLFAGTPTFAVPSLSALFQHPNFEVVGVLTQKPKPRGRGLVLQTSPVAMLAQEHNAFILSPENLRSPEVISTLHALHADVAVVVAYGLLIPANALTIFPHGWVNVHASLLPRWRGASPIQHALLAGDTKTGITLMCLEAGMDTGPIFTQSILPIATNATTTQLSEQLSQLGAKLLIENLIPYLEGKLIAQPQPNEGVTTARKITHQDGLLQFTRPAVELERKVRALTPWPGTYFSWNEKEIKVLAGRVVTGQTSPGYIQRHPEGFSIGTTNNLLVVQRVQYPGKSAVDAHAFLRGYPAFLQAKLA